MRRVSKLMLEFDSVRPPWHESNFPSFFQVRARGLELETISIVFALEQLIGPDPSSAPGMLYLIPRQTLHSEHMQTGDSKNSRVDDPPRKTVDYYTHSKLSSLSLHPTIRLGWRLGGY